MIDFFEFCNKISPLDNIASVELSSILKLNSVKKNEPIVTRSPHAREFYFIKKGIVKLCFNGDGTEFTMRFFEAHTLLCDIESCTKNEHSKYRIVAIEDTEFFSFSFFEFEKLCLTHHSLETFYRRFMTMANLNMMERISEILEENATKRYNNFIKKNPHLLQRISLGELSNYLGIT
ncbi:MAG: cyclic nucleotide-binding domain-containing protein [Galbibacter orientalis]|uniref:Crp/Fnr family transcriptional regulator n=1 Tax=Galbibacter orientalis TaxID=453852 RepID=UPI00300355FD